MSEHAAPLPQAEFFDAKSSVSLVRKLEFGAILGIILTLACVLVNKQQFAFSWLFAVVYFFTLAVGGLFWVLVHHAVDAEWSVVVRRQMENVASLLKYIAIFFIPVLLLGRTLYHGWWGVDPETDSLLKLKAGYLNAPFFVFRTIVYFVVFCGLAFLVRSLSIRQDNDGNWAHTLKLRKIGTLGLLLFAFSVAFATFDWLMSLEYLWFSTMWGVYIFAGAAGASMSLIVLLVTALRKAGYFKHTITKEHYFVMGKWMLAFTIFWAYIGFSQYMLIWYANIPEETSYFIRRNVGSWNVLSTILVIGRFFLPFPLLLLQGTKKLPWLLSAIAAWILIMQMLDIYLVVMPMLHEKGYAISSFVADVASLMTIGSILGLLFLRTLGKSSLFPVKDPRLDKSIHIAN
jgi:hypothetical protein